ncbi:MAG: hypothetical protein K6G58_01025 [Lachnospiraceae bacterium]|nr:hypothetical protein [Lachnospiraceae bacterium]
MYDKDSAKLLYEAFFAIAESYTSIVYMDVETERAYPISLDGYSERYGKEFEKGLTMRELVTLYAKETVWHEDIPTVVRMADKEYILERLKTENPVLQVYRSVHGGDIVYFRMKVVPAENGDILIYAFENIDSQFCLQHEIRAEKERHTKLLDGLSREYMSVWYLDGKSRKVSLVQNNGSMSENGEAVEIGRSMVDYHFSMRKYFEKFSMPEDFDRLMSETSYETIVNCAGDDDIYSVNYIRKNPDMTKSRFQICYAKITDESGIANFVMGFRRINIGESE